MPRPVARSATIPGPAGARCLRSGTDDVRSHRIVRLRRTGRGMPRPYRWIPGSAAPGRGPARDATDRHLLGRHAVGVLELEGSVAAAEVLGDDQLAPLDDLGIRPRQLLRRVVT